MSEFRHPQQGAGAAHRPSHPHSTSSMAGSRQHDVIRYMPHLLASGVCSVRSGHAHAADAMHNDSSPACRPMDMTLDSPPVDDSTSRSPQRQPIHRPFPKIPPAVLPQAALRDTAHLSFLRRRPDTRRDEQGCYPYPLQAATTHQACGLLQEKSPKEEEKRAKQPTGHLQPPTLQINWQQNATMPSSAATPRPI